MMTKNSYMKQLSLLSKWCLPEPQAKQVIQTYQAKIEHMDNKGNLTSHFGTPYQVIKPLLPPLYKNTWLGLFFFSIVYFAFAFIMIFFYNQFPYDVPWGMFVIFYLFFACLLNCWAYADAGKSPTKPPKTIHLAFCIATICNVLFLCAVYQVVMRFFHDGAEKIVHDMIIVYCFCCVLVAFVTLILCKISHKQWKSITVLAMGVLLSFSLFLTKIDLLYMSAIPSFSGLLNEETLTLIITYLTAVASFY